MLNPRIFIFLALFLFIFTLTSGGAKSEVSSFFMKEENILSSENYDSGEEVLVSPPRSWTGDESTRTREWKEIGTWVSEELDENYTLGDEVIFTFMWRETEQGRDDDYDARVQFQSRLSVDGEVVANFSDNEERECVNIFSCGFQIYTDLDIRDVSIGSVFSLEISYWSFSDIEFNLTGSRITLERISPPIINLTCDEIRETKREIGFAVDVIRYDGSIIGFWWDFDGDGEFEEFSPYTPFFTSFNVGGIFSITVKVTDSYGLEAVDDCQIIINSIPEASLYLPSLPDKIQKGEGITFLGRGLDADGDDLTFSWSSSIDGLLSSSNNFTIDNLSVGNHIIIFKVTDTYTDSSFVTRNLLVYTSPVAIAGQNTTGIPGVPLQFSGAGTDEDGNITKYEWDFDGDGVFEWSSSENGRELNVYNNEGTYEATLRVTDNEGHSDIDTITITISEKEVKLDDDGNIVVTDADDAEEGVPSISLIASLMLVGLLAIFRRK